MKPKVLFDITKREKRQLKDFPIIKCAEGEKILCVQRQHPIILTTQMTTGIIIVLFLLFSLVFIPRSLPQMVPFPLYNSTLIAYIALTIISALLVILSFFFITWYYQFYIITNKTLVHRHCFRISGGFYSEAVFGEKMHVQDIVRTPPNLIYDFLKIQDVWVYFHKLEREEPFFFKTPDNAQEIEDVIEDLIAKNHTNRPT